MVEVPELPLAGQSFFVTGSTRGIGQATACRLANAGARVIIHGRQPSERSERVLSRLSDISASHTIDAQHGAMFGDFETVDFEKFAQQAWDQFGPLDGWINNAGGDVLTGTLAKASLIEKLSYLQRVDVQSTLLLSRAIGRRMQAESGKTEAGRRVIVNVGWDQAAFGMAGDSGALFATTKGAIMAMSLSLAQTLAPQVRVNCVAPGWIKTEWGEHAKTYWDERAKQDSLMQRWGTPADVAAAICFLCRPDSSFVSGQVIPVNGGFRFSELPPC